MIFRSTPLSPRLLQTLGRNIATAALILLFAGQYAWAKPFRADDPETSRPDVAPDWESLSSRSASNDDLIDTLRQGFHLTYEVNQRTAAERAWFEKNPEYLQRVFKRSSLYLPYIVAEIERRKLPLELALLPIVESAYDPFAYSHGRAAGLWQMIPGTAKRFGIVQNWWYDGRRDIVDSTRAALDYLEYLYEFNDGDWLKSLASYNSGEGNVRKAVRRNRNANRPTDFWNLKLPRETSTYVPKLLALVDIVKNPRQFGLSLPPISTEPQFAVVDTGGQLDLALAAKLAGVDIDTIYQFNPGYNQWSTDPAGPHRIVIPVAASERFVAALDSVPAIERVRWQRHKIRNGEAISQIAARYKTTVAAIRAANNLRGSMIRAGDHLIIPVATKPLDTYSKSADVRLAKTQDRQRTGNRVEHTVVSGESFWSIGKRYRVSERQLAAWNGMAPGDTLAVGRKLVIWTTAASGPLLRQGDITRKVRYTVRSGDSLYLIASRFRVTVSDLVRWNNIEKSKILRPGQKLLMYVDVTAQSS